MLPQRSPDPLTGFEGVLLLSEGKGMGGREGKGEGEEKEERGRKRREKEREGKEGKGDGCVVAFGGMDAPEGLTLLNVGPTLFYFHKSRFGEKIIKSHLACFFVNLCVKKRPDIFVAKVRLQNATRHYTTIGNSRSSGSTRWSKRLHRFYYFNNIVYC